MTPTYDPILEARKYLYVREAQSIGQNRGLRVEAIQHWSGGRAGDSWCMEFLWMVFDVCYQGAPPFDRLQGCEEFRQIAKRLGWVVDAPQRGDVVLSINAAGVAHHVGIITRIDDDGLWAIAGNTSADGSSDNGDRVAEHTINPANKIFVRVP